jgi:drug/metabolite transporter (DMT)-like permease
MTTVDRSTTAASAPSRVLVLAAFAAIYFIWGSTYLAIRYAVETVPPFFMSAARFLVAGLVLYGWSMFRADRPNTLVEPNSASVTRRMWRDAFIVGALLIVGGTALVAWAERSVPSGITSLVLATTPLWMVLLESVEARRAPSPRVLAGVGVGIAGLVILIGSVASPGTGVNLLGVGALSVASLAWSIGAMYSRRATLPASPARATGMQMIAGSSLSLLGAFALGEHHDVSFRAITPASALALAYLLVAGALVGFSAYLWLMRVSTPSRVATHAYVNPVVAVLLGWGVAGEAVTARTGIAMAVIVIGVVLIVSAPKPTRATDSHRVAPDDRPRDTRRVSARAA